MTLDVATKIKKKKTYISKNKRLLLEFSKKETESKKNEEKNGNN
jgi:hypothetical protein